MYYSFCSEHTVEYSLTYNIYGILKNHFEKVIPFYFWASREGNNMSIQCSDYKVKLVAIYPRRPKVSVPNQDDIIVKFNSSLFDSKKIAEEIGISVLAGVPLVSSIMNLTLDSNCVWFRLGESYTDIEINVNLDATINTNEKITDGFALQGPLNNNDIVEYIKQISKNLLWEDAINFMRIIRSRVANSRNSFWGFMNQYKPFYLILH